MASMNSKFAAWFVIVGLFGAACAWGEGTSRVRIVTLSKIEAAKGRVREKLFTDWMTEADLKAYQTKVKAGKQQLLFVEYNGPRDKWRGIFTDKIVFRDFSWWSFYGEKGIEDKLNEEIKEGRRPVFIARNGNYFSMILVGPSEFEAARKALAELGIGEPKLK